MEQVGVRDLFANEHVVGRTIGSTVEVTAHHEGHGFARNLQLLLVRQLLLRSFALQEVLEVVFADQTSSIFHKEHSLRLTNVFFPCNTIELSIGHEKWLFVLLELEQGKNTLGTFAEFLLHIRRKLVSSVIQIQTLLLYQMEDVTFKGNHQLGLVRSNFFGRPFCLDLLFLVRIFDNRVSKLFQFFSVEVVIEVGNFLKTQNV